jgi:anti-sigma B factor antagonist
MQSKADNMMDVRWPNSQEAVVTLNGEFRMATIASSRRKLLRLARKNPKVLTIDMAEVQTIDTAGIAVLVEILRALHGTGCKLLLTGLRDQVRRMVGLTHLDQVLEVSPWTQEELCQHGGISPPSGIDLAGGC